MAASTLTELLTLIRRAIRDTTATYVFTDDELTTYIKNAIREYSKSVPREVKATLALVADDDTYAVPAGLIAVVSLMVGSTPYSVTELFAGEMTITPIPTANANAVFKYYALHSYPSTNAAGSYEEIDEWLIQLHVVAQCWETLAGDGAKYYDYTEGDIREAQGKTQAQFRAEADALYKKFAEALAKAKEEWIAKNAVAITTSLPLVTKISQPLPSRETDIVRDFVNG